jgi:hypothetical protein
MSDTRNRSARFYAGFYWIGVLMSLAFFAVVFASNTGPLYRFEHSRYPLSWMIAGFAVLSLVAAEFCHPGDPIEAAAGEESPELAPEWETIDA